MDMHFSFFFVSFSHLLLWCHHHINNTFCVLQVIVVLVIVGRCHRLSVLTHFLNIVIEKWSSNDVNDWADEWHTQVFIVYVKNIIFSFTIGTQQVDHWWCDCFEIIYCLNVYQDDFIAFTSNLFFTFSSFAEHEYMLENRHVASAIYSRINLKFLSFTCKAW